MIESLKDILSTWRLGTNDRIKLQHTYIIMAVVLLLAAGLVGLMNYDMGQSLLMVAIICAGIFLANAVAWSLLQSAVLLRISTRRSTTRKK